jgi:hypothetical protein
MIRVLAQQRSNTSAADTGKGEVGTGGIAREGTGGSSGRAGRKGRAFHLSAAFNGARIRLRAAAGASRSPAVAAPSNRAAILRSFSRSSCSVVNCTNWVHRMNLGRQSTPVLQRNDSCLPERRSEIRLHIRLPLLRPASRLHICAGTLTAGPIPVCRSRSSSCRANISE